MTDEARFYRDLSIYPWRPHGLITLCGTFTGVPMSLRSGRWRALRGIERELADCDPCLEALFFSFAMRARGEKMPRTEKIRTKPLRFLAQLRRRPDRRGAAKAGVPGPGC